MTADPLSRDAALERVKEAGRKAADWGVPPDRNPYVMNPFMTEEAAMWGAGHAIGTAQRKRAQGLSNG